jgi:hypothetical protein
LLSVALVQSEVLRAIADQLRVTDGTHLLTRLVGVEDAPEAVIKEDQKRVREVAQGSSTQ